MKEYRRTPESIASLSPEQYGVTRENGTEHSWKIAYISSKETNYQGENSYETDRHGHSAFRIEAGAAKILIDPFLSDNPSWDNGWSGYLAGKNSTQGGDR